MLAKMGYKEGEGIGKSVKGRVAPIAIDLKSGRTGLGVDEARKRQRAAIDLLKQEKGNVENFPCHTNAPQFALGCLQTLRETE